MWFDLRSNEGYFGYARVIMRSMRGDCDSVGSQRGSVNTPLGVMGPSSKLWGSVEINGGHLGISEGQWEFSGESVGVNRDQYSSVWLSGCHWRTVGIIGAQWESLRLSGVIGDQWGTLGFSGVHWGSLGLNRDLCGSLGLSEGHWGLSGTEWG